MTKYRICKNAEGDYKIQTKTLFFWNDLINWSRFVRVDKIEPILFKTKEEAEQKIIELKEREQKTS